MKISEILQNINDCLFENFEFKYDKDILKDQVLT